MPTVEEMIQDVKEIGGKWGQLANKNKLAYPEIAQIIEHYELEIERELEAACLASQDENAELRTKIQAHSGKVGGLQKRVNSLTKQVKALKEDNQRLIDEREALQEQLNKATALLGH